MKLNWEQINEVKKLIESGRRLDAIRFVRANLNVIDFASAREIVDRIAWENSR